jgi:hypothetical protein
MLGQNLVKLSHAFSEEVASTSERIAMERKSQFMEDSLTVGGRMRQ